MPPPAWSASSERYGSGAGSPAARANAGTRKGASASMVTTQGEMVLLKFLARNGPSGWYSQVWMSRADQSLRRQRPKRRAPACSMGTGSPCALPRPTKKPTSSS